jgi:hypothetical protein
MRRREEVFYINNDVRCFIRETGSEGSSMQFPHFGFRVIHQLIKCILPERKGIGFHQLGKGDRCQMLNPVLHTRDIANAVRVRRGAIIHTGG